MTQGWITSWAKVPLCWGAGWDGEGHCWPWFLFCPTSLTGHQQAKTESFYSKLCMATCEWEWDTQRLEKIMIKGKEKNKWKAKQKKISNRLKAADWIQVEAPQGGENIQALAGFCFGVIWITIPQSSQLNFQSNITEWCIHLQHIPSFK